MKGPMPRANRLNFVTWLRWHMRGFTSRVRNLDLGHPGDEPNERALARSYDRVVSMRHSGRPTLAPPRIFVSSHAESQFVENADHYGKVALAVFCYSTRS
jgi:hypothetical protein